ncbi:MAG: response regulator [Desulfovibrionales bacterium]|nr:response regulator [Desulfovibrionales bacterium]
MIPRILIADRQTEILELFTRILEGDSSVSCYTSDDNEDLVRQIREVSFAIMLLDVQMVLYNNFALLRTIREISPATTILIMGYLEELEAMKKGVNCGASGYIIKPVMARDLRKEVGKCLLSPTPRRAEPPAGQVST